MKEHAMRHFSFAFGACALVALFGSGCCQQCGQGKATSQSASPAAAGAPEPTARLFNGLGDHHRTVTTSSKEAQQFFNQGLNFLYAFNHDEAIRSFQEAATLDPKCAMAWWGIAYANGPHINNPVVPPERARAAWEALTEAKENVAAGTEAEKALIAALGKRYANLQPEDRRALDEAYASAMREAWQQFPKDADIGALFAEALMDLRPWDLWKGDGKPQPQTPEIIAALEKVMEFAPKHPLALHLYIHALEASPEPGKADEPADRLRHLAPALGHLVHMPSHIDIRRGRWQEAVEANRRAIQADANYRALAPSQGFYRIYMAHNHHMLAFAAIMTGQSQLAMREIRTLLAGIPKDWLAVKANAAFVDGFFALPFEAQMRFGQWGDVLKEPEPDECFPVARTLWRCARGIAYAATGKVKEAREEQTAFRDGASKVAKEAQVGNNNAGDVLAVAEWMLEGEILLREGKLKEAVAALREAAAKEDKLKYDEPPDWLQPVRHALGAVLLHQGAFAEAEQVYREDLRRWPENGWSLYGLARTLDAMGRKEEAAAVRARFQKVWQHADVEITSSCYCQPGER
jgi:tetratricopeptide (TPR) repeat protein